MWTNNSLFDIQDQFNMNRKKSIRKKIGAFVALTLLSVVSFFATPVFAQAWEKIDPQNREAGIVSMGITEDGKYPIYMLSVDTRRKIYETDGYQFSEEELPRFMVRVQQSDVNKNGYRCDRICYDRFGNIVGLNPNHYKVVKWDGRTIEPIGREKNYPVYPFLSNDLDDINYTYRRRIYRPEDVAENMKPIQKKHVNRNGYRCEFLCVNQDGQVVGWNPNR